MARRMIVMLAPTTVLLAGMIFAQSERPHGTSAPELGYDSRASVGAVDVLADTSREDAQLEAALADRRHAVSIVARMEGMLHDGIISQMDYDRAKDEAEQAAVRLRELRVTVVR